jgi:hypothetical protein
MAFVREKDHWLFRFSPQEWVFAGLGEVKRAEGAYARGDSRGGLAGARRAAGMALNGVLVLDTKVRATWGRTYMEHLTALRADASAPEAVRRAAGTLLDTPPPGQSLIVLRTKATSSHVVEAARDVIAHAYALVARAAPEHTEEEAS